MTTRLKDLDLGFVEITSEKTDVHYWDGDFRVPAWRAWRDATSFELTELRLAMEKGIERKKEKWNKETKKPNGRKELGLIAFLKCKDCHQRSVTRTPSLLWGFGSYYIQVRTKDDRLEFMDRQQKDWTKMAQMTSSHPSIRTSRGLYLILDTFLCVTIPMIFSFLQKSPLNFLTAVISVHASLHCPESAYKELLRTLALNR